VRIVAPGNEMGLSRINHHGRATPEGLWNLMCKTLKFQAHGDPMLPLRLKFTTNSLELYPAVHSFAHGE